jgi:hypothetical protein
MLFICISLVSLEFSLFCSKGDTLCIGYFSVDANLFCISSLTNQPRHLRNVSSSFSIKRLRKFLPFQCLDNIRIMSVFYQQAYLGIP